MTNKSSKCKCGRKEEYDFHITYRERERDVDKDDDGSFLVDGCGLNRARWCRRDGDSVLVAGLD